LFSLSLPAGATDLIHNSADTASTKWQAQGGWGVTGGKYGKFTCATCHAPDADNLKNIKPVISTMNGESWPNGSQDVTVGFLNQTSMGDDSKARSSSNRICEVCHSQNRFHNFNTTNNTEGLGHPTPKVICTNCHKHNTGFKAGCGGCHGNPPTSAVFGTNTGLIGLPRPSKVLEPGQVGAHHTHTQVRNMVCDTCHYIDNGTIKMPNQSGTIQIGFFGFGGKVTSGTYVPYSSASRGYPFASGTPQTVIAPSKTTFTEANRCQNVYCHGGGAPGHSPLGGGLNQQPRWDAQGQNSCGSCHGTTPANPPTLGSHAKHAGISGYSYSCDTCHPVSGDNSHVQGNLRWKFNTADSRVSGATYKAAVTSVSLGEGATGDLAPSPTYGQCSNVACHTDGKGGAANVSSPTWGDVTAFAACSGCHGGNAVSGKPITSGQHALHINNAALIGNNFGCIECHAQTVSDDTTVSNRSMHVNQYANYSGQMAGRSKNSCNTAYCHSNGKRIPGMTVDWYAGPTIINCTGCHGNDPAPDFVSKGGEPNYANSGFAGSAGSNSHKGHAAAGASSCQTCHLDTVVTGGTAIKPNSLHLNKSIDVTFDKTITGSSAAYNKGLRQCTNVICHSGGNPVWGDASSAGCKTCHGSLSATHYIHIGNLIDSGLVTFYNFTGNKSVASSYRFGCANCHPTDPSKHRNGNVDLTFAANKSGGSYLNSLNNQVINDTSGFTRGSGTLTCETVYCHSNGRSIALSPADYRQTPNWYGGTFGSNRCGSCHDNPPQYAGQSHYNPQTSIGNVGKAPYRETGHLVGIHFANTGKGNKQNGFLSFSSVGNMAHGNNALASTIACYTCHSGIVSSSSIDTYAMDGSSSLFRCSSCHNASTRTPLQTGQINNAALHVNGSKDVVFAPITFKTKAQLSNVANALGWTRNGNYKSADSYDSFDLSVATWDPATRTCLTACHVNQPGITWGAQLKCVSCHARQ
jgi:predicted CxxxxCH...CXXCH cytochrome family protein